MYNMTHVMANLFGISLIFSCRFTQAGKKPFDLQLDGDYLIETAAALRKQRAIPPNRIRQQGLPKQDACVWFFHRSAAAKTEPGQAGFTFATNARDSRVLDAGTRASCAEPRCQCLLHS
ncbi:MAG: hypothetical protein ACLRVT_03025 [Oscillospiraceae bacterium]